MSYDWNASANCMDLLIALGIPIVIFFGMTIIFLSNGVPNWVLNFNRKYSAKTWLYGVIALGTISLLIALFKN